MLFHYFPSPANEDGPLEDEHSAFEVANVSKARQEAITKGAKDVGKIVTLTTKTGSKVTWCYMSDPEGNIFELQSWSNKL